MICSKKITLSKCTHILQYLLLLVLKPNGCIQPFVGFLKVHILSDPLNSIVNLFVPFENLFASASSSLGSPLASSSHTFFRYILDVLKKAAAHQNLSNQLCRSEWHCGKLRKAQWSTSLGRIYKTVGSKCSSSTHPEKIRSKPCAF